jgi:hypothetical protein
MESEFSDGTFLTTSNALESARVLPFTGITPQRFRNETTPEELLRQHHLGIGRILTAPPQLSMTRCETMEDFIGFQHRMQSLKSRHKKQTGCVGVDDLRRVRGRELNEHELAVAAEIEKLKRDDTSV